MKKRIAVFLLALMMLMLAACAGKTEPLPLIVETQPTQATQAPETQATQPTQATQATQATQPVQPVQPTQPSTAAQPTAPLEYTGIYWRTWNENIGGTTVARNAYYILNANRTGYAVSQAVGALTWTETQLKDQFGQTSRIELTQENGAVNLLVYEFSGSPSVYRKIDKLPAEIQAMITEFNTPKPTASAPEITKNPTSETVNEGGNAYFVARANNYSSINWYIVSADRSTRMPVSNAPWNFQGLTFSGEGTTTLLLSNIPASMNGWCVEAVFTGEGGTATTGTCYITVNKAARAELYAVPSSGIYVANQSVQLTAAPGSFITYELYDDVGNKTTGTVQSGGYVTVPLIPNCRYVARLVAYVVGDQTNLTVCEYTMDGMSANPTPAPQPSFNGGTFSGGDVAVMLTPTGTDNFFANVSVLRLCSMDGSGSYSNGTVTMFLTDPSGSPLGASYNVNSGTLTITYSTWEYLPQGTTYSGIY